MIKRKSFIIHNDSLAILDDMTNEQAGILIKSIKFYQKNGVLPELDFGLKMAITPFINQFIRDEENYQKTCEARRLAGAEGGKQKVANASKSKQKVANLADNNNENKNKKDNKKDFTPPTLEEVKKYCEERSNNVDANKFLNFYESKGWMIGKSKMRDWKASVRTWEDNKTDKPTQKDQTLCQVINNLIGSNLLLKIEKNGGAAALYFKSENDFESLKKLTTELKEEIKKTIFDKMETSKLEFKF